MMPPQPAKATANACHDTRPPYTVHSVTQWGVELQSREDRISRRQSLALGIAATLSIAWSTASADTNGTLLRLIGSNGEAVSFDEDAIRALPWCEIHTTTAWTDGIQVFDGPRLRDVLLTTGESAERLSDRQLKLTALNDFVVEMPARDAWAYDPILARVQNGRDMAVRDKGPLWLVYPRDAHRELQSLEYDERWIWQLSEIHILK